MILKTLSFASLDALWEQWEAKPTDGIVRHEMGVDHKSEPWYAPKTRDESDIDWVIRMRRRKLWHLMTSPEERGFFKACKTALNEHACKTALNEHQTQALADWLNSRLAAVLVDKALDQNRSDRLEPYFRAHLLCARRALDPDFWPETGTISEKSLEKIQKEVKLPINYLRDLASELCNQPPTTRCGITDSVVILLIDAQNQGHAATLRMTAITPGDKTIYPAPAISLVDCDPEFIAGLGNARSAVDMLSLGPNERDFRWDLNGAPPGLSAGIAGPSASAAMALLLARLGA